jgi:hypothetical protein
MKCINWTLWGVAPDRPCSRLFSAVQVDDTLCLCRMLRFILFRPCLSNPGKLRNITLVSSFGTHPYAFILRKTQTLISLQRIGLCSVHSVRARNRETHRRLFTYCNLKTTMFQFTTEPKRHQDFERTGTLHGLQRWPGMLAPLILKKTLIGHFVGN